MPKKLASKNWSGLKNTEMKSNLYLGPFCKLKKEIAQFEKKRPK